VIDDEVYAVLLQQDNLEENFCISNIKNTPPKSDFKKSHFLQILRMAGQLQMSSNSLSPIQLRQMNII
jgi:hypothetical protein